MKMGTLFRLKPLLLKKWNKNMDRKIKFIFENYNFLAHEPFKISVSLAVIAFAFVLMLFGLDIYKHVSTSLGGFLIAINLVIAVVMVVYIAYMQDAAKKQNLKLVKGFNYRLSLQMSRFLQKELISPVDSSDYNYSAQSQIQKYNNRLRLLSFVAVFEREAYFIRLPKNIASRRDIEDLKEIANDIALDLDMRTSSFQPYINNQNLGLGYVSRGKYEVMRLA